MTQHTEFGVLYYTPGQGMLSSRQVREVIRQRDGENCWLCGIYVAEDLPFGHPLHASVDHVIEVSKGGRDHIDNLRLAHAYCNSRRSNPPRRRVSTPIRKSRREVWGFDTPNIAR